MRRGSLSRSRWPRSPGRKSDIRQIRTVTRPRSRSRQQRAKRLSMLAASHTVRPAAALDCEIKVVAHDSSQWESIRPIWSELVEASKCSFFVTAEWIETWLEVFGSHLDPSILIV